MRYVAVMFVVLFVGGCATNQQSVNISVSQCPPLKTYNKAQREKAAAEISKLANDSQLAVFISDYGKLREACRIIDRAVRR